MMLRFDRLVFSLGPPAAQEKEEAPLKSPSPRRLWKYVSQHLPPGRLLPVPRRWAFPPQDPGERSVAAQRRFHCKPPDLQFREGTDRVEIWDADDFDPWESCSGTPCA